ncbi:hypothetical protein yfred0001_5100 [Yersinia frederiksenii ATCC 33641]|nr:hypothetical protein yfred0001_5100 [Yersinia frederiksenii ATCC 33641]
MGNTQDYNLAAAIFYQNSTRLLLLGIYIHFILGYLFC